MMTLARLSLARDPARAEVLLAEIGHLLEHDEWLVAEYIRFLEIRVTEIESSCTGGCSRRVLARRRPGRSLLWLGPKSSTTERYPFEKSPASPGHRAASTPASTVADRAAT
jgi:hypothetical protein